MRVLAFSDLHGNGFQEAERLTKAHQPDWIVLCGDMLPDFNQRPECRRLEAQRAFWQEHRHAFLREGAITTFVLGNHELTGFRDAEMSTIPESLAGQVVRLEGIPGDSGPFSFAKGSPDPVLQAELDNQLSISPEPLNLHFSCATLRQPGPDPPRHPHRPQAAVSSSEGTQLAPGPRAVGARPPELWRGAGRWHHHPQPCHRVCPSGVGRRSGASP